MALVLPPRLRERYASSSDDSSLEPGEVVTPPPSPIPIDKSPKITQKDAEKSTSKEHLIEQQQAQERDRAEDQTIANKIAERSRENKCKESVAWKRMPNKSFDTVRRQNEGPSAYECYKHEKEQLRKRKNANNDNNYNPFHAPIPRNRNFAFRRAGKMKFHRKLVNFNSAINPFVRSTPPRSVKKSKDNNVQHDIDLQWTQTKPIVSYWYKSLGTEFKAVNNGPENKNHETNDTAEKHSKKNKLHEKEIKKKKVLTASEKQTMKKSTPAKLPISKPKRKNHVSPNADRSLLLTKNKSPTISNKEKDDKKEGNHTTMPTRLKKVLRKGGSAELRRKSDDKKRIAKRNVHVKKSPVNVKNLFKNARCKPICPAAFELLNGEESSEEENWDEPESKIKEENWDEQTEENYAKEENWNESEENIIIKEENCDKSEQKSNIKEDNWNETEQIKNIIEENWDEADKNVSYSLTEISLNTSTTSENSQTDLNIEDEQIVSTSIKGNDLDENSTDRCKTPPLQLKRPFPYIPDSPDNPNIRVIENIPKESIIPNANYFDVPSITEMEDLEAEEQAKQLLQDNSEINSSTVDENEQRVKELLPNVSKDFKKLKLLESNLQRIQKMRRSFDPNDDIWEELVKMEKLFQAEKKFVLQKYATSAVALFPLPVINIVPKAIKKFKTEKMPISTIEESNTTMSETDEEVQIESCKIPAITTTTTRANIITEVPSIDAVTIPMPLMPTITTTPVTTNETETDEEPTITKIEHHNLLNSKRETIKMTISPIKLPPKSNIFQLNSTRPKLLKLWADDDDDNEEVTQNDIKTAIEAIRKAVREKVEKVTRPTKVTETALKSKSQSVNTTPRKLSVSRNSQKSNSIIKSPSSRSTARSSVSPLSQNSARRHQYQFNRSRSRSRSWQRRGNSSPNQRHQGSTYRRRTASTRKEMTRTSTPTRKKRPPRTPKSTPPPFNERAHISPTNYNYRRRGFSESRSRSRSPTVFKPPSPPAQHSESPTPASRSHSRSRTRSRSWSNERMDNRCRAFKPRSPFSPRRLHSPTSPREYEVIPYSERNVMSMYDHENEHYEQFHYQDRTMDADPYMMNNENIIDSYYYNMPPHMQMAYEDEQHPNYVTAVHPNAEGYMTEHYYDPAYLTSTMVNDGRYANVPFGNAVMVEENMNLMAADGFYAISERNQNQSVLKELTKAPAVAVQKGNVLEIVPTQNTELMHHFTQIPHNSAQDEKIMTVNSTDNRGIVNLPPNVLQMENDIENKPKSIRKKTINEKRKYEVEKRQKQVMSSRQCVAKSSILRQENKLGQPATKKVFFEDGVFPKIDSGDEDLKAVEETLLRKIRKLRTRSDLNMLKIENLLPKELNDDDSDVDLNREQPPPPPPPGVPPPHLEQPIYLRPISPDTYVYFHYDPEVCSMFVSAHEHALPPRLIDPKKASAPTEAIAALMMPFMTPRVPPPMQNQPMQSMPPPTAFNTTRLHHPNYAPLLNVPLRMRARLSPPISLSPHKVPQQSFRPFMKRNEFVTQPLYPTSSNLMSTPPPTLSFINPTHHTTHLPPPALHQGKSTSNTGTVQINLSNPSANENNQSN